MILFITAYCIHFRRIGTASDWLHSIVQMADVILYSASLIQAISGSPPLKIATIWSSKKLEFMKAYTSDLISDLLAKDQVCPTSSSNYPSLAMVKRHNALPHYAWQSHNNIAGI